MATKTKHRKIIDLPFDVFKILSVKAVAKNTNLKNYIEKLLEQEAQISDEEIYKFLQENKPTEIADTKEQQEFRNWLNQ